MRIAPHRATRSGHTILESILALILTGVGLLALATASAAFLAHATWSGNRVGSVVRIESVMDSLRTIPCAALAGGSAAVPGLLLTWTVAGSGPTRRVDLTATLRSGARQQQHSHVMERAC